MPQKRCRILHRRVDAAEAVRGARAAGDEADAGLAGELAPRLRHVGGAALVPAGEQRDGVLGIVQRVERGEVALARHAERRLDAVHLQLVDQDLAAAAQVGTAGHADLQITARARAAAAKT
jgi:hypothetical protein